MEYRLNKYISSSGICSRREADRFIEQGNVTINGKRAELGMRVLPGQQVRVNGQLVVHDVDPVYIAFNKPTGIVSTTDTRERDNIVDYIGHEQRIFPVGRLDKDSQGLILLTNDGDIINKILRAGNNHKKEYLVTVDRPFGDDFLVRMSQGVPILDRVTRKCELRRISPQQFHITLTQGLNRQIRRMCEYFGFEVTKLERTQIMHIKLGNLKKGSWRNLTESELETLFDLIEDSENTVKPKKTAAAKAEGGSKTKAAAKPKAGAGSSSKTGSDIRVASKGSARAEAPRGHGGGKTGTRGAAKGKSAQSGKGFATEKKATAGRNTPVVKSNRSGERSASTSRNMAPGRDATSSGRNASGRSTGAAARGKSNAKRR